MRLLRSRPDGLVRSQAAACARSVMRRHADFPGIGGEAARLPSLWQGEARAARLSGGQSALQQALCLLCRPSLPVGDDQGRGGGTQARLAHGQSAHQQYMEAQLKRAGTPGPGVIGIDEIAIRKGHTYRIVVSDLLRGRPIWFGGKDRSEASMGEFHAWLGEKKSARIRLAVMDMWKPFRLATAAHAPQAAILFDKFHVMRHLGEALDHVRKSEYGRLAGRDRRYIKGQKYTLLSRKENLTLDGKKALKTLLSANKRLNTAYVLKESFGQ